ncbi:MAG: type II secretion system F family protein [Fretibacterium sp.]|jgi:type IV pilus assembly protein PilC|nr:type II secretion system F family protein [Fretibacterium sp.]
MKFKYRARGTERGLTEGYVEAPDEGRALETLRRNGVTVLSLKVTDEGDISPDAMLLLGGGLSQPGAPASFAEETPPPPPERPLRSGSVPAKTIRVFFRQMATMVQAGLGLSSSIDLLAEQEHNPAFKDVLRGIQYVLGRGFPLSQAMKNNPIFAPMITSMVQAGEESGRIGNALEGAATLLEKRAELRRKVLSALFYPVFVVVFALVILTVFVVALLPQFRQVFGAMNIELPGLTRYLFAAGEYCSAQWKILLPAVLGVFGLLTWLLTRRSHFLDWLKLKLPFFHKLFFKASMARATRTLAVLSGAGVPLPLGLELARGAAGNTVIGEGFAHLQERTQRGESLGDAAKEVGIFPTLAAQMMRIGEETGRLDNMLDRVASWYDQELDEELKTTTAFLEPILILFVGGVVAVVALSVLGPITSALSQLG